jgi:integrase
LFDAKAAQHLLRYLTKKELYPLQDGDALWLGRKGPLSADGIRQVIERRRKEAGVDISAHSFRRGLAARALRNGVSGPSTSAILGWAQGSLMLSRYGRGVQAELAESEYRSKLDAQRLTGDGRQHWR